MKKEIRRSEYTLKWAITLALMSYLAMGPIEILAQPTQGTGTYPQPGGMMFFDATPSVTNEDLKSPEGLKKLEEKLQERQQFLTKMLADPSTNKEPIQEEQELIKKMLVVIKDLQDKLTREKVPNLPSTTALNAPQPNFPSAGKNPQPNLPPAYPNYQNTPSQPYNYGNTPPPYLGYQSSAAQTPYQPYYSPQPNGMRPMPNNNWNGSNGYSPTPPAPSSNYGYGSTPYSASAPYGYGMPGNPYNNPSPYGYGQPPNAPYPGTPLGNPNPLASLFSGKNPTENLQNLKQMLGTLQSISSSFTQNKTASKNQTKTRTRTKDTAIVTLPSTPNILPRPALKAGATDSSIGTIQGPVATLPGTNTSVPVISCVDLLNQGFSGVKVYSSQYPNGTSLSSAGIPFAVGSGGNVYAFVGTNGGSFPSLQKSKLRMGPWRSSGPAGFIEGNPCQYITENAIPMVHANPTASNPSPSKGNNTPSSTTLSNQPTAPNPQPTNAPTGSMPDKNPSTQPNPPKEPDKVPSGVDSSKPNGLDKADELNKAEKAHKPEKQDKPENPDKTDKAGKPDKKPATAGGGTVIIKPKLSPDVNPGFDIAEPDNSYNEKMLACREKRNDLLEQLHLLEGKAEHIKKMQQLQKDMEPKIKAKEDEITKLKTDEDKLVKERAQKLEDKKKLQLPVNPDAMAGQWPGSDGSTFEVQVTAGSVKITRQGQNVREYTGKFDSKGFSVTFAPKSIQELQKAAPIGATRWPETPQIVYSKLLGMGFKETGTIEFVPENKFVIHLNTAHFQFQEWDPGKDDDPGTGEHARVRLKAPHPVDITMGSNLEPNQELQEKIDAINDVIDGLDKKLEPLRRSIRVRNDELDNLKDQKRQYVEGEHSGEISSGIGPNNIEDAIQKVRSQLDSLGQDCHLPGAPPDSRSKASAKPPASSAPTSTNGTKKGNSIPKPSKSVAPSAKPTKASAPPPPPKKSVPSKSDIDDKEFDDDVPTSKGKVEDSTPVAPLSPEDSGPGLSNKSLQDMLNKNRQNQPAAKPSPRKSH